MSSRLTTSTPAAPLVGQHVAVSRRIVTGVVGTVVFAALTWVGANIRIPLEPVPVTLQTLFVLLAGAIVGRSRGALSQALYIGVGALGVPVFAGAAGLAVLAGPTGGYLAAFIVAPLVVGAMMPHARTVVLQTAVFTVGTLIIFALGVTHLGIFYTHGFLSALKAGFVPFLPGAVFKVVAAVSIYRSYSALTGRGR